MSAVAEYQDAENEEVAPVSAPEMAVPSSLKSSKNAL